MTSSVKGLVHGKTIELDAPVPPLEGKRVRIVLALDDEAESQSTASSTNAEWKAWTESGPQGPIDDEDAPEFP